MKINLITHCSLPVRTLACTVKSGRDVRPGGRNTILIIALLFQTAAAYACPLCDKQQPKILQGITHGTGPQSNWDYVIVWATVIIVLFTLFYTVKWLIRPGEMDHNHIKRTVIN